MHSFAFALDGKTDMMSLNPLEMTNFEMMGAIFGIGGVLLTIALTRLGRAGKGGPAHHFVAQEDGGDAAGKE